MQKWCTNPDKHVHAPLSIKDMTARKCPERDKEVGEPVVTRSMIENVARHLGPRA